MCGLLHYIGRGCYGRDYMVVAFTTTCAIVTGQWFSLGTLVSLTNEIDRHDITEILLKVALNTINQTYSSGFEP